jgi:hypothetical protein
MGIYKLEIVKSYVSAASQARWRNVYHLNTPTLGDAAGIASDVVAAESAITGDQIAFVQFRVSDPTKVEPSKTVDLAGTSGDQDFGTVLIPQWNVMDVTFEDTGGGRLERKYYRCGYTEAQIDGNKIESAVASAAQTIMDTLVSTVIAMCAPNGDTVTGANVHSLLGMRQLSWHRRTRPGFHRGYIPD